MSKKEKKRGLLYEFRDFAFKGNVFDMAIGVIVGAIFKDLVVSFTDNIVMPIVYVFTGSADFSGLKIRLPSLFGDKIDPETGKAVVNFLNFGDFLSFVIDFLILTFVVFMIAKTANRLRERDAKRKKAEPEAPPEPGAEELLLTEIRDLLKNQTE